MTGVIGMLWYEQDPQKTLEARIAEAAATYRQKYGREPNVCLVEMGVSVKAPAGIDVFESPSIQHNHLLIGVK